MKKALISAAAVAALMGAGVAQAEVKGYGLLDLAYGTNFGEKDGDAGFGGGGNSGNRFGVKGDAELTSDVKFTFDLQAGFRPIDTNDGAKKGIVTDDSGTWARQAWAGLAGSFGEVRYGKQDSALFNTFIGLDYNGWSNTATTVNVNSWTDSSLAETLQYFSPELGPVSFRVSYTSARAVGVSNTYEGDTLTDLGIKTDAVVAAGLTFAQGPITVAAGYKSAPTSGSDPYMGAEFQYALDDSTKFKVGYHSGVDYDADASLITLGAVTAVSGVTVGAAYSIYEPADSDADTVGSYEVFANKELVKNLIGYAEVGNDDKDGSDTKYAIGVIYLF